MNNDEVRVLIITGAGAAFSAGGDPETHPAVTAKDRETRIRHLRHSVQVASVVLPKYRYRQANNAGPKHFMRKAPAETILSNKAS